MAQEKKVWIVGHKNPDTDSICAAIAYANLKNKTEEGSFIPKKAGALNNETKFVLDYFKVDEPETIDGVGTQIKDIEIRHTPGVTGNLSLKNAWALMKKLDVVTLPVVNDNNILEGIIVNGDIAYSYMDVVDSAILSRARTQYKNIIETLNGNLLFGNEHAYFVKGRVLVASGSIETIKTEINEDDLIISGNIKERQLIALDQKPSCMIICCAKEVDTEVIKKAEAIQCVLISTEYDTFTTARLINQSMPVKAFMTKGNLITFDDDDYISDVNEITSKIRHRDFPVLDDTRHYVGMFSRRHLMGAQKKQIILVDHNEKSQAVDGIEEANILEIIDHHRLGSLETISPIFFRNQPVGCTSTIIYQMYIEKECPIDKIMAGLMLSAILSDTLMFRSPTCTDYDKFVAKELAEIAGIDIEQHAIAMFEAGSDFSSKPIDDIFYGDFKEFKVGDIKFGVSQLSAVSDKQLKDVKADLQKRLDKIIADRGLDRVYVMLTNILEERTELLYAGSKNKEFCQECFGQDAMTEDSVLLPGVVSRKKQLIPQIIGEMQK